MTRSSNLKVNSFASLQHKEGRPGRHVWHAERPGGLQELDERGHGPRTGEDEGSLDWYVWICCEGVSLRWFPALHQVGPGVG